MNKFMMMVAATLLPACAISACTTLGTAQTVAGLAQSLSVATPQQATTLNEAINSATLVTRTVDVVVKNTTLDPALLTKINIASDTVHSALVSLYDANAKGQSLTFGAFNAAVKAFNDLTANAKVH